MEITAARLWELLKTAEDRIPSVGVRVGKLTDEQRTRIGEALWEFICAADSADDNAGIIPA